MYGMGHVVGVTKFVQTIATTEAPNFVLLFYFILLTEIWPKAYFKFIPK